MSDLPNPLVPSTVDLRRYPRMPLDVRRLLDSETALRTKPEEFKAAVMLWAACWHEVPASSLPNDDLVLADRARYGNQVKAWKRVKTGALRGFILCNDGRLYHQVVAEIAIDSWGSMLKQRHRTKCGALKKWGQRHKQAVELPTFELWITREYPEATGYLSRWTDADVPEDIPGMSLGQQGDVTGETASKGMERTGLPVSNTVSRNHSAASRTVENPAQEGGRSTPRARSRSGAWRTDANAAARFMSELGLKPGRGEALSECVRRIEQELARRDQGQDAHA
jgi:hypothetical protein